MPETYKRLKALAERWFQEEGSVLVIHKIAALTFIEWLEEKGEEEGGEYKWLESYQR